MPKSKRTSVTRRWHRFFGAGSAIFVVFLVVTGLLLNHSHSLTLDQKHVSNPLLLAWYGLGSPEKLKHFAVASNWLSFTGTRVYLNGSAVTNVAEGVGAVSSGSMFIAASGAELLLLDKAGNLVERQPWGPPGAGPIDALGQLENGVVVVRSGEQLWLADAEMLTWQLSDGPVNSPSWSFPGTAPDALRQAVIEQYRGHGLSLERMLLDIHSGRIFGTAGVIIYDLFALALGFLAISGLILWLRGRRNVRRNGRFKEQ